MRSSVGVILGLQSVLTLALVGLEVTSPRYHGVFARRINPALDQYLRRRG